MVSRLWKNPQLITVNVSGITGFSEAKSAPGQDLLANPVTCSVTSGSSNVPLKLTKLSNNYAILPIATGDGNIKCTQVPGGHDYEIAVTAVSTLTENSAANGTVDTTKLSVSIVLDPEILKIPTDNITEKYLTDALYEKLQKTKALALTDVGATIQKMDNYDLNKETKACLASFIRAKKAKDIEGMRKLIADSKVMMAAGKFGAAVDFWVEVDSAKKIFQTVWNSDKNVKKALSNCPY